MNNKNTTALLLITLFISLFLLALAFFLLRDNSNTPNDSIPQATPEPTAIDTYEQYGIPDEEITFPENED